MESIAGHAESLMPLDVSGPASGQHSTPLHANAREFVSALERMRLLSPGEVPAITPLTGGVSSDIVRADLRSGPICIKRALRKLKVAADWQAPVERNRWEVQWMKTAGAIVPHAVPRILAEDRESGMFAMEFLEERDYPVWKLQLRDGIIDPAFASQVGRTLALIHAHTAGNQTFAQQFATDHIFFPIRLEPYLCATARTHPDLAESLEALVRVTGSTKLALVHGDVSPKNILSGPHGPVFLDAECAWYGDPAFDLAFCLNHMLLKCLWRPQWSSRYLECFDRLHSSYLAGVIWEPPVQLEDRTARLLPGLFLARVDGKSPVEYVCAEWQHAAVRDLATQMLLRPVTKLAEIQRAWQRKADTFAPMEG
jgi:aminoglycoside phosphotransferase (APT) family kinase protein